MDKHIGAQYYTIRNFCQTLSDFDESCKKIHDIGYRAVQLSGIGNFSGEEVRAVLDKYDLSVYCTHRPAANYLENPDAEIAYHKAIGCKIAGLGAMPRPNEEMKDNVHEFTERFRHVADELSKHNITFAYHNHAFEFEKTGGEFAFDILQREMKSDHFKLILDVYWLAYAGLCPAKFIREHKGQIACVHLKDLKIVKNTPTYAEVGQGNLDWDEILAACEDTGVPYALVEQDECDGNPFDSLKISYDYLCERGYC